jgi:hypothetical protein
MGVVYAFQLAHFSSGNISKLFPTLSGHLCAALSRDFAIRASYRSWCTYTHVFAHQEHIPKR